MATTVQDSAMSECLVIRDMLRSIAEKEIQRNKPNAAPQIEPTEHSSEERGWLEFVADKVSRLPWYDANLPDGRTPPQPKVAVEMVTLLAAVMDNGAIHPSSVNTTWAGGVAVEWHIGGIDLEIACQPDGSAEYSFEDQHGAEYEGPAWDNLALLRQLAGKLPASRQPMT